VYKESEATIMSRSKSYGRLIDEQEADALAKKISRKVVVPVVKAPAPVHKEMKEWARNG
jgi:hypothetical protein